MKPLWTVGFRCKKKKNKKSSLFFCNTLKKNLKSFYYELNNK